MRILDRYIVKSTFLTFLGTLLIFCLLFILIDSASNLDEYIDQKVPLEILLRYYLSYLPLVIVETCSIACLIAVLFTFTNLNTHNEIIALRSSGLNFWQITRSAIIFSLLVSTFIFFINERYIPQTTALRNKLKSENIEEWSNRNKKRNKPLIHKLTFYGLKNRLYYIDTFDPNTNEMEGIIITEYDEGQNIKERIRAYKGIWTGIAWKFLQCQIVSETPDDNMPTKIKVYEEKLMDIKETPKDFLKQRIDIHTMNIQQLREFIARFKNSGNTQALNDRYVDLYQKIAFPFSPLIIVLVGLPFSLMLGRRRAQTFTSLGIAIAIGFFYYVCEAVGLAFGYGGLLSPFAAAWMTPFLFVLLAFYLIRTKF